MCPFPKCGIYFTDQEQLSTHVEGHEQDEHGNKTQAPTNAEVVENKKELTPTVTDSVNAESVKEATPPNIDAIETGVVDVTMVTVPEKTVTTESVTETAVTEVNDIIILKLKNNDFKLFLIINKK